MFLLNDANDDRHTDVNRLWATLRRGEREALDGLFRLFYTPLFDYGIKIISDEEMVKDGIQKLFLRLWERHNSLAQADSVQAYLLLSLRRILLRQVNRQKKRYEYNRKYMDEIFSVSFSMEELLVRIELDEEKKQELVKAINHLNSRQKETLFLRYYHGLTNGEIATIMNINRQSVRNNLSRAIKSLRGIIKSSFLVE